MFVFVSEYVLVNDEKYSPTRTYVQEKGAGKGKLYRILLGRSV